MQKNRRLTNLLLIFAVLPVLLSGCGDAGINNREYDLTYYIASPIPNKKIYAELSDALYDHTGIRVCFAYSERNGFQKNLNIMRAAETLPDIIEYDWSGYEGGAYKALSDNVIISLNSLLEEHSPNFRSFIANNPEVKADIMTSEGTYFSYPNAYEDKKLSMLSGLVIRQDWLESCGLSVPKTVGELEIVLTIFKSIKKISAPLSFKYDDFHNGFLTGAFGLGMDYYVKDGKVRFGPYEEEFYDFLLCVRQWYESGLIDPGFISASEETVKEKLKGNAAGAAVIDLSSISDVVSNSYVYKALPLVAAPFPMMSPQSGHYFAKSDLYRVGASITGSCKHAETAAKLLDFGYGEEGRAVYGNCFSKQGFNGSDSRSNAPFVARNVFENNPPAQNHANVLNAWNNAPAVEMRLPVFAYDAMQSDKMAVYTSNLREYVDDMVIKFILGVEPLDNFGNFRAELERRGIADVLNIMQDCYARYLSH